MVEHKVGKQVVADREIYSAFQPIFSFSNQACIGAEVLIRGHQAETKETISVPKLLEAPEGLGVIEYAELINRLHLTNWKNFNVKNSWLFLNLDFFDLKDASDICLDDLISDLKMQDFEIVIEVVESEIVDEELFEEILDLFRNLGCLIALDDFGAGHSNVDRIWKVEPDIVKLDRSVLIEASKSVRGQSILRNLTYLIKQAGSICLIEGVETKEQALMAMDAGVDLVQGFYFARPEAHLDHINLGEICMENITQAYPDYQEEQLFKKNIQISGYSTLFLGLNAVKSLFELEQAMDSVADLSFVKRFFILDEFGYQVSDEHNNTRPIRSGKQHKILKQGKGLCWKNRRYFRKSMDGNGRLYISEPYRSLIDMQLCLTLAKRVEIGPEKQIYVICFDVFYHDKSSKTVQISV